MNQTHKYWSYECKTEENRLEMYMDSGIHSHQSKLCYHTKQEHYKQTAEKIQEIFFTEDTFQKLKDAEDNITQLLRLSPLTMDTRYGIVFIINSHKIQHISPISHTSGCATQNLLLNSLAILSENLCWETSIGTNNNNIL